VLLSWACTRESENRNCPPVVSDYRNWNHEPSWYARSGFRSFIRRPWQSLLLGRPSTRVRKAREAEDHLAHCMHQKRCEDRAVCLSLEPTCILSGKEHLHGSQTPGEKGYHLGRPVTLGSFDLDRVRRETHLNHRG
jgi:hypothetical protein